jgi:hypothetical protein
MFTRRAAIELAFNDRYFYIERALNIGASPPTRLFSLYTDARNQNRRVAAPRTDRYGGI